MSMQLRALACTHAQTNKETFTCLLLRIRLLFLGSRRPWWYRRCCWTDPTLNGDLSLFWPDCCRTWYSQTYSGLELRRSWHPANEADESVFLTAILIVCLFGRCFQKFLNKIEAIGQRENFWHFEIQAKKQTKLRLGLLYEDYRHLCSLTNKN